MQSQPSERVIVAAKLDPANYNNTTQNTDYVDMSKFHEALFILQLGSVDSTVDFKLRESQDASGTNEPDLSGKAITQFNSSGVDKIALVNLKATHLSVNSGYRYVRGRATVGNGSTNIISIIALGLRPRFGPASDDKLAAVTQIVA